MIILHSTFYIPALDAGTASPRGLGTPVFSAGIITGILREGNHHNPYSGQAVDKTGIIFWADAEYTDKMILTMHIFLGLSFKQSG